MRTSLGIVLAMSLVGVHCLAQNSTDTSGLTMTMFKKILNEQFTNLITGQSKNSIGNFASLDLKEADVSFCGSSIFDNGSVLVVKANGAVSDGLFSIFSNSKLNTKVSLDVQYNCLAPDNRSLSYYDDSFQTFRAKEDKIWADFRLDSISIMLRQERTLLVLKEGALKELTARLTSALAADTTIAARKDSLKYELARFSFQRRLDSIALSQYPSPATWLDTLENDRARKLRSLRATIDIYGFQLGWFSIGGKVQNNSFRLFQPSAAYDSQIEKTNFVSYEARLQYSYYKWSVSAWQSYFWCLGFAFSYGDNLSDLTAMPMSEVKNYGPNPNDRTTRTKYNAYTGEYKKDLTGWRIYVDWYKFLFDQNTAAVHLYSELQTQGKEKPLWNVGVGFLLSFKDAKDKSSVVNAELYYNLLDASNATNSSYGLFERNSIGIRFSVPITFKTQQVPNV